MLYPSKSNNPGRKREEHPHPRRQARIPDYENRKKWSRLFTIANVILLLVVFIIYINQMKDRDKPAGALPCHTETETATALVSLDCFFSDGRLTVDLTLTNKDQAGFKTAGKQSVIKILSGFDGRVIDFYEQKLPAEIQSGLAFKSRLVIDRAAWQKKIAGSLHEGSLEKNLGRLVFEAQPGAIDGVLLRIEGRRVFKK